LSKSNFHRTISNIDAQNQKEETVMETKFIVTYVVCDDVIKSLRIKDDSQARMNIAEVITTAEYS